MTLNTALRMPARDCRRGGRWLRGGGEEHNLHASRITAQRLSKRSAKLEVIQVQC